MRACALPCSFGRDIFRKRGTMLLSLLLWSVTGCTRPPAPPIAVPLPAVAPTVPHPDRDRVVVVMNEKSAVSRSVTEYYRQMRGVTNVVVVACPDALTGSGEETILYPDFQRQIETPLRTFLAAHPKTDFIVLTKGLPLRLRQVPGRGLNNDTCSVDGYLASLDYAQEMPGRPKAISIPIKDSGFTGTFWINRFWDANERFSHTRFGGYLVTRLDGYTEADAKALVTRAIAAEQEMTTLRAAAKRMEGTAASVVLPGDILVDTCPKKGFDMAVPPLPLLRITQGRGEVVDIGYSQYNADMRNAAQKLQGRGFSVVLDETDTFLGSKTGLRGYVSWGSNDNDFKADSYHSLRFAPGAVVETAVSTSGRTMLPTTSGQSLIADLISQGATGAKGYTDEPLLFAIASPTVLFDRYTRGWTLAESYYAASRVTGWTDVVFGDPLCAPYALTPLPIKPTPSRQKPTSKKKAP